jgi:hypothetical protein
MEPLNCVGLYTKEQINVEQKENWKFAAMRIANEIELGLLKDKPDYAAILNDVIMEIKCAFTNSMIYGDTDMVAGWCFIKAMENSEQRINDAKKLE